MDQGAGRVGWLDQRAAGNRGNYDHLVAGLGRGVHSLKEPDVLTVNVNINKVKHYLKISKKPLIVGGGLSNDNDLKNLFNLNNPLLEGVIAGKSFYSGVIKIKKSLEILK